MEAHRFPGKGSAAHVETAVRGPAAPAAALSYWPADTREPVRDTTVGGLLCEVARAVPERVALVDGTDPAAPRRSWTYAALVAEAERVAHALLARFAPGERIAVWAPNCPEWVFLQYGAALAGLTLVSVNPAYLPEELGYVLGQSRAAGLFLVPAYRGNDLPAFLGRVRLEVPALREVTLLSEWEAFCASGTPRALPQVRPEDPALLLYTSGTTGFPKGALLPHRGIANNPRLIAQRLGVQDGDVWLNNLPMFNITGGVINTLGTLACRGTQVAAPFEPALALRLMEEERPQVIGASPTIFLLLMDHPEFPRRDHSALRTAYIGGAPVPAELIPRIEATFGVACGIVYGQTEASGIITQTELTDAPEDRATTIGRPLPQAEVKIIDPATGTTVPTGTIGELCARGYSVMTGYFDRPEATRAAIDGDGWLHTGDLAAMDVRGYCRIEGRLKDMIIRGGQNIYPSEIEALLLRHPQVANVAVVGLPDAQWGEIVAAVVQPRAGEVPTEEELFRFCRAHLAAYKTPRRWAFVEGFPLTPSGKIQKQVLRDRLVGNDAGHEPVP
jgi:fatty-acyl-CoA synthase